MMFDPPDFPYKELTDTLGDNYSSDDIFFNNDAMGSELITNDKDLVKVTEAIISTVENQLSFNSNISGKSFNVETVSTLNVAQTRDEQNLELYVVQSENLFNYEPTLLDDNTVNQFLLPIQESSDTANKEPEAGPDLLALHSCVICHEIFTTDAELLDHTVLVHATVPTSDQEPSTSTSVEHIDTQESSFECEWLVCGVCERVLSTALDSQPRELLCCTETRDGSNIGLRKLATMFVCDYCSYLFANGEALDRHRLACFAHEDYYPILMENPILESVAPHVSEHPCGVCGRHFVNGEELRAHTIQCQPRRRRPYSGNTNKMWNCGSCNQLFTTARELYRHKRGEDRPPGAPLTAYVCEDCDKVLGSMCALHTHKKMHKVSKPGYPCRVCGRRFNQSGHLAIHMRMHTGERPYPCDLCDKAFKVKVERDDHRRTHTGERPFACTSCSKTFTAAARLREHARIHTDQRPYKCEICGAAFRRPYARTVHTLIHTGEKPHECDVCGTAFRRSGDMWKHKRTLHGIQGASGDTN
ncbi:zinc finger protein 470-like [Danaus plexippus]|uniref:zinc finger protein 470-like n=1 Tax=Danaus plexippus TaxID=13037 RepID=UPI002AAFC3F5|nr:zinc finger protein 470-like [Danaus plexippus]